MRNSQKKSDKKSKSGLILPTIEKKTASHDHYESMLDLEELQEQYPTDKKNEMIRELK